MNIDKKATDLFQSKLLLMRPTRNYCPGDLLAVKPDTDVVYIRQKFRPMENGYPFRTGPAGDIVNRAALLGSPFMFLGWAVYGYAYFSPGQKLGQIGIDRPHLIVGMNILLGKKIFFLTCNQSYSFETIRRNPEDIYFICDVLHCLERFGV